MNSSRIKQIADFLSVAECNSLLETIESVGFEAQYSGEGKFLRSRAQFANRKWSELIWDRLSSHIRPLAQIYDDTFVPEPIPSAPLDEFVPVHLNKLFRCYKYGAEEQFRRHQDFAHEYSPDKRTFFTVLIYLNGDFTGGETTFDGFMIKPEQGMLVMFPHELEHEGCKVQTGTKYTLRTDVVFATEKDM